MLPGISGMQLLDELQDRWPSMKVFSMSGYAKDEIARRGTGESTVRFLQKPFEKGALAREIRAAFEE